MKESQTELNKKLRKNVKSTWWIIFFTILFVIIIPFALFFAIFSIDAAFGLIMVIFGIIATCFNKKLYEYMVKLNVWGFGKMGIDSMGKSVKSNTYRIFYRIATFFVGLLVLYIGLSEILRYFGINWKFLF